MLDFQTYPFWMCTHDEMYSPCEINLLHFFLFRDFPQQVQYLHLDTFGSIFLNGWHQQDLRLQGTYTVIIATRAGPHKCTISESFVDTVPRAAGMGFERLELNTFWANLVPNTQIWSSERKWARVHLRLLTSDKYSADLKNIVGVTSLQICYSRARNVWRLIIIVGLITTFLPHSKGIDNRFLHLHHAHPHRSKSPHNCTRFHEMEGPNNKARWSWSRRLRIFATYDYPPYLGFCSSLYSGYQ